MKENVSYDWIAISYIQIHLFIVLISNTIIANASISCISNRLHFSSFLLYLSLCYCLSPFLREMNVRSEIYILLSFVTLSQTLDSIFKTLHSVYLFAGNTAPLLADFFHTKPNLITSIPCLNLAIFLNLCFQTSTSKEYVYSTDSISTKSSFFLEIISSIPNH